MSQPEYEIFAWVRDAPLDELQRYLDQPGIDVNQQDGNGKALLHEVVYDLDSREKLSVLLAQPGIAIDIRQHDGTTPLYRAALAGNAGAVDLLLEHGADVNNRNHDNGWTVLMCAAAAGDVAIVAALVRRPELDSNAADDIRNTALHIAAQRGHDGVVELLLRRPEIDVNRKNHMGWTALSKAAFGGHVNVVERLLQRSDVEVNFVDQDRQTPLFHATSARQPDVVRALLADRRTNPAITNRPARLDAHDMAVAIGDTTIAQLIAGHDDGADELAPTDDYVERSSERRPTSFIRPHRR